MPWQGHLFIGERVSTNADVRAIFTKLGYTGDLSDEEINDKMPSVSKTVELKGVTYPVSITFSMETDDGAYELPSGPDEDIDTSHDTYAYVGFALTSRYSPAILDRAYEHGRVDPFELDLEEIQIILAQARTWWPDCKVLMCDCFF